MSNITHAYLGGLVHKRGDDGFLYVNGLVSDDTLDLDQQRCDPKWLDVSVPQWMKSAGNVRLMHQPTAVGKAKEIAKSGTGWNALIKVTNPQTATDIEEGVLTGLSVGIKNARVEKSLTAPNGLIVGGDIIEVSLVDRPANPSCVIEMAKSAGAEWDFKGVEVATDVVVSSPITPEGLEPGQGWIPAPDAPLGQIKADGGIEDASDAEENIQDAETVLALDAPKSAKACATCDGKGTIKDGHVDCPDCTKSVDLEDDDLAKAIAALEAAIEKRQFSDAKRKQLADKGQALPNGGFPIENKGDVENAVKSIGLAKNRSEAIAHIKSMAKKLNCTDLIPANWKTAQGLVQVLFGDVQKAATPDEWMHDPTQIKVISDGLIDFAIAELNEMKNGEDERYDVQQLLSAFDAFTSWVSGEANEGETTPPFNDSGDDQMSSAYISLGVSPDLIKAASADDATEETKTELKAEIRKAVGFDEEIAIYKAQLTEMQETVTTVKAELAEVQELAAPGGPVLRQTSDQRRKSAAHDTISAKAAEIRARADAFVGEPSVKQALYAEADKLDFALNSL